MLSSLRDTSLIALFLTVILQAAEPTLVSAQEGGTAKPSGFKFRFSFEGEVDVSPRPAATDGSKTPEPGGSLGGQVKGSFSGTWSIEPATVPSPAPADGASGKAPAGSEPPARNNKLTDEEQAIVDQTNAERKKANLPPLIVHPTLMTMAREQSKLMAEARTLSHQVNGRSFEIRLRDSKYISRGAGENCAEGAGTPKEAVADWMQSPGHKANILNADYREIGVGLVRSSEGRPYYTQVFAAPATPAK